MYKKLNWPQIIITGRTLLVILKVTWKFNVKFRAFSWFTLSPKFSSKSTSVFHSLNGSATTEIFRITWEDISTHLLHKLWKNPANISITENQTLTIGIPFYGLFQHRANTLAHKRNISCSVTVAMRVFWLQRQAAKIGSGEESLSSNTSWYEATHAKIAKTRRSSHDHMYYKIQVPYNFMNSALP